MTEIRKSFQKNRNASVLWKVLLWTEKCNFKFENTKIKIGKSKINLETSPFDVNFMLKILKIKIGKPKINLKTS